jgi:hypothetical protein
MLNNAAIRVESRCFAYVNNENNVKQCRVSVRARVHDWEKRENKIRKTGLNRNMSQLLGDARTKQL